MTLIQAYNLGTHFVRKPYWATDYRLELPLESENGKRSPFCYIYDPDIDHPLPVLFSKADDGLDDWEEVCFQ